MRRLLCIMLAAAMLICMPSCQKPDETAESGSGEYNGDENDSPKTPQYAEKYSEFYSDDTIYNTNMYTGYSLYFAALLQSKHPTRLTLGETLLDSPGEALYAHEDPTCSHMDGSCPMAVDESFGLSTKVLIVYPEYRELPLAYYFAYYKRPIQFEDYHGVGWDTEEGEAVRCTDIREYDVETGEVRVVATIPYYQVFDAWFYRGKLYLQSDRYSMGGRYRFGVVDLATGEFKDTAVPESVYMIGITNGRIWYITVYNIIGSCSLQLTDYRDEYDIGASEFREGLHRGILNGCAGDGVIYYERDCRNRNEIADDPAADWYMVSDLYMLKADDIEAGAVPVAKDVLAFDICDGDLYYTQFDYKEFGMMTLDGGEHEFMRRTYDGGSLYRYDHNTGEKITCYEDIGVGIENTSHYYFEVVDGKVIFVGLRYRDFEGCKLPDGRDYLCIADIKTGKWFVAYAFSYMMKDTSIVYG